MVGDGPFGLANGPGVTARLLPDSKKRCLHVVNELLAFEWTSLKIRLLFDRQKDEFPIKFEQVKS